MPETGNYNNVILSERLLWYATLLKIEKVICVQNERNQEKHQSYWNIIIDGVYDFSWKASAIEQCVEFRILSIKRDFVMGEDNFSEN